MTTDAQTDTAGPEVQSGPRLVPGRECGTCMMCCKVQAIDELGKPPGVWCRHVTRGVGCGIYETRPAECRRYYCHWMVDAKLPDAWKPDRAKFTLTVGAGGNVTAFVDPGLPGAWRQAPYYETFKRWAAEGLRARPVRVVMVRIGTRGMVVLPDREVDIGTVGPNESIRLDGRPDGTIDVHKFKRDAERA
ncbi:MAG: hypothetical protein QOG38_3367 [Hyphomicrobiales bacterium]|jgi:hypothetical protein|nr:hypothetical protein [Hyphomicrobiales bacterium]